MTGDCWASSKTREMMSAVRFSLLSPAILRPFCLALFVPSSLFANAVLAALHRAFLRRPLGLVALFFCLVHWVVLVLSDG